MRAVTISDGKIVVADRPDPVPGSGHVLVRVRGAGINNADLIQQAGFYPPPPGYPPDIPGLELAGEVVELGPGALRFQVGDRVMAVVGGAAQAELATVHERAAMPVPDGVTWEAAGGFPEAFTTAHDALFTQCRLAMGERVAISGAAGGVGTAAVQLAAAAGARVTATVRNPALRDRVATLAPSGWVQVIDPADLLDGGPYDVVLELVGAPNMADNVAGLASGGRISVIGTGAGARAEIDLLALMRTRGLISASTLRPRPLEQKADAARRVEASVLHQLAAGRLQVPIAATFPMASAAEAYERFAAGGKFGKIVLVA